MAIRKAKLKVYIVKKDWIGAPCDFMVYNHTMQAACWGEEFYYVDFKGISKHWTLIGEF